MTRGLQRLADLIGHQVSLSLILKAYNHQPLKLQWAVHLYRGTADHNWLRLVVWSLIRDSQCTHNFPPSRFFLYIDTVSGYFFTSVFTAGTGSTSGGCTG